MKFVYDVNEDSGIRIGGCETPLAIGLIFSVVLVSEQFPALPLGFSCPLAFFPAAVFLVRMLWGYDKQLVTIFAFSPFHKDLLLTKSYRSLHESGRPVQATGR